jgi:hypothetical protein
MLDMVPELVRENVGSGEISRCTESPLELVEKSEVEVDSLIQGAIEGAHHRLSRTAT